ncbi:hypothetical protein GIB67_013872 [Kingdonia uniflora]|uniref:Uncharacterized protein n=1 Tax=Kingdonia uniflora TaxID=39325 RepID=A0A7J7LDF4_9MAGN|nr:hypothetical protein GIB67_013872 [Kingdonia uniflora]
MAPPSSRQIGVAHDDSDRFSDLMESSSVREGHKQRAVVVTTRAGTKNSKEIMLSLTGVRKKGLRESHIVFGAAYPIPSQANLEVLSDGSIQGPQVHKVNTGVLYQMLVEEHGGDLESRWLGRQDHSMALYNRQIVLFSGVIRRRDVVDNIVPLCKGKNMGYGKCHGQVKKLEREKRLSSIVDRNLTNNYNTQELEMMIQVALLCTQASPEDRPTMSEVVRMLEGEGLAERWEEWQQVEVTRRQEYDRLQRRFDWGEDSVYNQSAIELSGGR